MNEKGREPIHGHARKNNNSKEYSSWQAMRQRCLNENSKRYPDYGGRGIKICERWKTFQNFLNDMGLKPTPKHSLERLDVNGDYTPENCVWATDIEQSRNKRTFHTNTSGVTGVGWFERMKKWRARIDVNKKTIFLGYFDSFEEAAEARKKAEKEYWK